VKLPNRPPCFGGRCDRMLTAGVVAGSVCVGGIYEPGGLPDKWMDGLCARTGREYLSTCFRGFTAGEGPHSADASHVGVWMTGVKFPVGAP